MRHPSLSPHSPYVAPEQFTTTRQYRHLQPNTDPLYPHAVAPITRLHRMTTCKPTYEWLFVATRDTGPTADRHHTHGA